MPPSTVWICVPSKYEERYAGLMEQISGRLAELAPADADAAQVADAIVRVMDTEHGKRPFRVHVDPADDGSEAVSAVADRIRADFLTRIGLGDLLTPHETSRTTAHPTSHSAVRPVRSGS